MRGWLIDIYADDASNSMVYWLRTRRGAERVVDRAFLPKIYVHSTPERLSELEGALPILDAVKAVGREEKRIWLGEEPREVLAVTIGRYSKVEDVAHTIDNRGRYRDYTLFDVDMRFSQRYLLEKGVFPMGLMELSPGPRMLDDPYAIDYEQPPLSSAVLTVRSDARRGIPSMDDRLISADVAGHTVDGSEEDVIRGICDILAKEDPDVVYTDGGDAFAVPFLYRRAKDMGMHPPRLGRDDGAGKERKGKSYFSYGRILYKPPTHPFAGGYTSTGRARSCSSRAGSTASRTSLASPACPSRSYPGSRPGAPSARWRSARRSRTGARSCGRRTSRRTSRPPRS